MKKFSFIGLFLLLSTSFFAQNDTLITNNDYKWKIGVKGILDRGIYETPSSDAGARDVSEESFLFNFGLQVIYKLPIKYNSIETGIFFYKRALYYEFSFQFPPTPNQLLFYSRKEFNNIHLPLKYRMDNKFFYFSLGGYMEYLISTSTKREDLFNNPLLKNEKDKKLNLGLTGSLGVEKQLSDKITLFIEAEFSSNLTFLNENQDRLRNYGIGFGLNFKI